MKNFLSVVFLFLAYTCWLYPVLFVQNLLKCVEAIVQQKDPEEYKSNVSVATFSLICMGASPFVIAMLFSMR